MRNHQSGLQGFGNSTANRFLLRRAKAIGPSSRDFLEIGGSSGEHLKLMLAKSKLESPNALFRTYTIVDPAAGETDPQLFNELSQQPNIKFLPISAEDISLEDNSVDIALSTCVLAHTQDPERVFSQLRRVTRPGGTILVAMPTDPMLLNQLVKALYTYPRMKRMGYSNPSAEYARNHRNGVVNLLALAREIYSADQLKVKYWPFGLPSVNLNLMCFLEIRIKY